MKRGSERRKTSEGFTVVELMTVLMVLAVVVALLMGLSGKVTQAGKTAKNVANLRAIGGATLAFAVDHQGVLPSNGARLDIRNTSVGSGLSLTGGAARHLVSKKHRLGLSHTDYLAIAQLYSPFARAYRLSSKDEFFFISSNEARIGYLFYSLPRVSSNHRDLVPGLYNDTVRENPRTPIYSDFCLSARAAPGYDAPTCSVLYLDGHVETFPQEELSKYGTSWTYVIQYFSGSN